MSAEYFVLMIPVAVGLCLLILPAQVIKFMAFIQDLLTQSTHKLNTEGLVSQYTIKFRIAGIAMVFTVLAYRFLMLR